MPQHRLKQNLEGGKRKSHSTIVCHIWRIIIIPVLELPLLYFFFVNLGEIVVEIANELYSTGYI